MLPLPIEAVVPELREQLSQCMTVLLEAPPGAGKSTLLPLRLLDAPWLQGRKIIMLEPRRLAARAVASRMAQLLGESVGETVGFRVRFESQISARTRIEVVTEGILTRKLQADPALEDVGLVIFDEFHERSLHADLGLVLCRQVQDILRDDLRILIMSATLATQQLAELLGDAPIITSAGRQYPIQHHYVSQDDPKAIAANMSRAVRRALAETTGDILAFLPGTGEIQRCQKMLEEAELSARVVPLYGDLNLKAQEQAILPDPHGRRKVVLATSIAETSLTIAGIQVVIDSGWARVPRFDPRSGLTRLETVQVTKDAADQRAGRAGRLGPGTCYRLWAQGQQGHLIDHREPEILQADLAPLALDLAQWGIEDAASLDWPTPPPPGALHQARLLLTQLGAVEGGKLSPRGQAIQRLPTHPRIAVLLLEGQHRGLVALAADIAALLEERDPLPREAGADLHLRIDALADWRAGRRHAGDSTALSRVERLAKSWRSLLRMEKNTQPPDHFAEGLLLASAYPDRVARQAAPNAPRYRLANGRQAALPPQDALDREAWLAIGLLDAGLQEGRIYLAAPLDPQDLRDRFSQRDLLSWDSREGLLVARRETLLFGLPVSAQPLQKVSETARMEILCAAVRETPTLLEWDEAARDWQARVMSLRAWRPEEGWPDVSDTALLDSLEDWLGPFLGPVKRKDDFARLKLVQMLPSRLPWELSQRLDLLAPSHVEVPTGSNIRVAYQLDGSAPILAVRLQEVFGWMQSPTVNEGRTRLLMHLLSPAYRPVQVTQDLASFWANTYADVRKDIRGRYPKHHWPEDPYKAEAVRGIKRKS
jgi:ATP-dependent helicase HrpB